MLGISVWKIVDIVGERNCPSIPVIIKSSKIISPYFSVCIQSSYHCCGNRPPSTLNPSRGAIGIRLKIPKSTLKKMIGER